MVAPFSKELYSVIYEMRKLPLLLWDWWGCMSGRCRCWFEGCRTISHELSQNEQVRIIRKIIYQDRMISALTVGLVSAQAWGSLEAPKHAQWRRWFCPYRLMNAPPLPILLEPALNSLLHPSPGSFRAPAFLVSIEDIFMMICLWFTCYFAWIWAKQ